MTLELEKNPDILSEVEENLIKVGFALETGEKWLENAKEKLQILYGYSSLRNAKVN